MRKFIFGKHYSLGEALDYIKKHCPYKSYGLKFKMYDECTVVLAVKQPITDPCLEFDAEVGVFKLKNEV